MLVSELLQVGAIYNRAQLRDLLQTQDQTINTRIFQPRRFDSILLFVTEKKSTDMIPYQDRLDGNILQWESQKMGRKDSQIIEHQRQGLEVIVFYRESKNSIQITVSGSRDGSDIRSILANRQRGLRLCDRNNRCDH